MPGIAVIIGGETARAEEEIMIMREAMRHEPSYEYGITVHTGPGVAVAFTAHPGSFTSGQPFWNAAHTLCLFFTGECFGLDRADSLGAEDGPLKTASAGAILNLFEEHGEGSFARLNGWFAGTLLDLQSDTTFVFNDRYGLGRLYCHQTNDTYYFASEAKALLSARPSLRQLDEQSLAEQFSCGCVLQNRTLYRDIALLPPASLCIFRKGELLTRKRYFTFDAWEQEPPIKADRYCEALTETFSHILPPYLEQVGPVAMSLTGGLDGRMIMAFAPETPGSLPCYTFGGMYRDCADVRIARRVAKWGNHSHQVIPIGDGFLRQFPTLAPRSVYLSDGTMDVTGAAEIYGNRFAREIAPVRLTGNYGSEILRRNVAFKPANEPTRYLSSHFRQLIDNAAVTYKEESQGNRLRFIVEKQTPWHHYSRFSVEQSQLTVRSPFLDNELVKTAFRAPDSQSRTAAPALCVIARGNPRLAHLPTDRGLQQPASRLAKLRHGWQEATVRAEYMFDYGMPPWLAKINQAARPLQLERLFLGRHKFYHFRAWYRDQLAPYVQEVLLDGKSLSRPYVERSRIERIVSDHVKGRGNYTVPIHKLLTAELMHRQFIDTR